MAKRVETRELIEATSALFDGTNLLLDMIEDIGQPELDAAYAAIERAARVLVRLETPGDGGARQGGAQET